MSLETRVQNLEADKQASTPINLLPNMGVLQAGSLIPIYNPQTQRAEYINESAFGGGGSDPTNNIKINTLYVPVDFNAPTKVDEQIVTYFNSFPFFEVDGNTLQRFIAYKFTSQGSFSSVETHLYELQIGKGSYGTSSPITVYDIKLISIINQSDSTSNIYDLGEIGDVDPIEDVVNATGPYDVFNGVLNVFKTTRSGDEFDYIYTGQATKIGVGETQTVNNDYIDLNTVTPATPTPTASYYDTFFYKDSFANDLSNFTPNTPFNVAKTLDGTFYFISDINNIETFGNTRLYFLDANTFVNLGTDPDIEDAAFLAWQIQPVNSLVNGQTYLFNRWLKTGGGTGNISQGVDSDEDINYISLVTEASYPVGAEIPNTMYAVELEEDAQGWGLYTDGTYTLGSPFSISQGTTLTTLPNDASTTIETYLPFGVTSFFGGIANRITPKNEGDSYLVEIRFKAVCSINNGFFDIGIDIGSGSNIIVDQTTELFSKTNGTEQIFSIRFSIYSLATFVSNGGRVFIIARSGNLDIYDIVYKIDRLSIPKSI